MGGTGVSNCLVLQNNPILRYSNPFRGGEGAYEYFLELTSACIFNFLKENSHADSMNQI